MRPQAQTPAPAGIDAPTPAREKGLQPYGALTLFFRWRKKSVQKKASGTATPEAARPAARNSQISAFRALPCPALVFAQACQSLTAFGSCAHWAHAPSRPKLRPAVAPSGLSSSSVRFAHPPGKRLLMPILTAGLAMSRAAELVSLRLPSRALGARLFPPSKWAGLFPSAAYRRSAPPQSAWGRLTPLQVGKFQCGLGIFAVQKASGISNPRWPLLRAMRPVAEWRSILYNWQEAAPDRRAVAPVVPRR